MLKGGLLYPCVVIVSFDPTIDELAFISDTVTKYGVSDC
jgi:hypothetical protein